MADLLFCCLLSFYNNRCPQKLQGFFLDRMVTLMGGCGKKYGLRRRAGHIHAYVFAF